jgi:hypothetical protein
MIVFVPGLCFHLVFIFFQGQKVNTAAFGQKQAAWRPLPLFKAARLSPTGKQQQQHSKHSSLDHT